MKQEIISWLKYLLFSLVFVITINNYVIVNANIPTGSMENTLNVGDRIIANRWAYIFSEPERFDVVVFKNPDDESILYIKRIIGLPGEKVEIKDGKVYVNDNEAPLNDSFTKEQAFGDFGPYFIPENCYFMLGDNRNRSKDSRLWENTFVAKNKILGKAQIKYFPNVNLIR